MDELNEDTEIVRVPSTALVNGQPVESSVIDLASTDQDIDTAVVSFFDVDYIRRHDDDNDQSERARERSDERRFKQNEQYLKGMR